MKFQPRRGITVISLLYARRPRRFRASRILPLVAAVALGLTAINHNQFRSPETIRVERINKDWLVTYRLGRIPNYSRVPSLIASDTAKAIEILKVGMINENATTGSVGTKFVCKQSLVGEDSYTGTKRIADAIVDEIDRLGYALLERGHKELGKGFHSFSAAFSNNGFFVNCYVRNETDNTVNVVFDSSQEPANSSGFKEKRLSRNRTLTEEGDVNPDDPRTLGIVGKCRTVVIADTAVFRDEVVSDSVIMYRNVVRLFNENPDEQISEIATAYCFRNGSIPFSDLENFDLKDYANRFFKGIKLPKGILELFSDGDKVHFVTCLKDPTRTLDLVFSVEGNKFYVAVIMVRGKLVPGQTVPSEPEPGEGNEEGRAA